jgi:hypothetical protein
MMAKISISKLLLGSIFLWLSTGALAQWTNQRQRCFSPNENVIFLDSAVIFSNSIKVLYRGQLLQDSLWSFNPATGELRIDELFQARDSICVSWRVMPGSLRRNTFHKDTLMYSLGEKDPFRVYSIEAGRPSESLLGDRGLRKSGSISRGITVGNAQNLSVNSTLNLQLSGKLSERFQVLASITDNNIPIQPNGNSQQLQDFDQVFIQINDDKIKMIAGDFILRKPRTYFMNYFKRAQGVYFVSDQKLGSGKLLVESSAAISKGKFGRNVIQGIEGNQGPYKLKGTEGEQFIVVLAGTEAVFIDGRPLERGQDRDYVIDYNAAEIVFTPRQFITKDRRITVEFQYSEKQYARPMLQSAVSWEKARFRAYLNFYLEGDAKNQPLQQTLSDNDKKILSLAGDDPNKATTSGIMSSSYSAAFVMYAMVDSLGFDSILVYSTDSTLARFRAVFSDVGQGNADYVEDGFTASGRIYKWVKPETNNGIVVHQGRYAPVRRLTPPKRNAMILSGVDMRSKRKNTLLGNAECSFGSEFALSRNDANTFSSIDSGDDDGMAYRGNGSIRRYLLLSPDDSISAGFLQAKATVELVQKNFNRIERFREVEFERNWNIQNIKEKTDLKLYGVEFSYFGKNRGTAAAGFDMMQLSSVFQAQKARTAIDIRKSGLKLNVMGSFLNTGGQVKSHFLRHKSDISFTKRRLKIGFMDEQELNTLFKGTTDTILPSSYGFYDWQVYAGTADSAKMQLNVYYRDRRDSKPDSVGYSAVARAEEIGLRGSAKGRRDNRLAATVSNRKLYVIDPERFFLKPESTLLLRTEYADKILNGFILLNTFYETGSGLEQKREFIYLEVPAGQGVYVWKDYNANGVRELNEFEIAQFSYEANFIRSFVPTSTYVRVFSNQLSQTITLSPERIIKSGKTWARVVKKASDQFSFKTDRRTGAASESLRFNPLNNDAKDSALIALNTSIRNVLFFNKSNPLWGMELTNQKVSTKTLLTNGFESRSDDFVQLTLRWNFWQSLTALLEYKQGQKAVSSDFLLGRNYTIDYFSLKPKITWQPGTSSRFALVAEKTDKVNSSTMVEKATLLKLGVEGALNSTDQGSVQFNAGYTRIDFKGDVNGSLAFDMLEGLNAGNNLIWGATIQRTIGKSLQLNLSYNGRKPEGLKTIHAGGVQVRAFF